MTRQWWRTALILYTASFCLFAITPIFFVKNPLRTSMHFTDHLAHWGSALLMAFRGLDVYREPVNQLCEADPEPPPGVAPADSCRLPDHPRIRTFGVNWQQYPRVYPPGAMLFAAPAAALYALTSISLSQANLIIILECLLAAHIASLLILASLWRPSLDSAADPPGSLLSHRHWNAGVLFLILPYFHLTLVSWSLFGIYDPASIACVVAGALLLARERPAAATAALSAAIFLHFRALWYLPLLGVAAWRTLDRPLTRRTAAALGVSLALLVPTGIAFVLLWPALQGFPTQNPVYLSVFREMPAQIVTQGLAPLCVLAFLAWEGSWLTAAAVAWQLVMIVQTHEVRAWHALFLWPWVAIAATEKRGTVLSVLAVLLLLLAEARHVFHTWPLNGEFMVNFL